MNAPTPSDKSVLVIAPSAKDLALIEPIFDRHGIQLVACGSPEESCEKLDALGGGALMVAEEILGHSNHLTRWIRRQPPWSDLPILVLARPGADSNQVAAATYLLGNVTILERPMRVATLVSAVQSALRARHRQYQIREHLAEHARAEAKLRENDQHKDEFLAILAHELRNPLAPMSNALHILNLSSDSNRETAAIGKMMERQLGNMKRLVDDLLEVSRVTRGELELRLERANLSEIIVTAVEASQPLITAHRHQLEISLPQQPIYLQADVLRLSQVVSNLLNNAAKYTRPGGRIALSVDAGAEEIAIHVTDNGAGIAPELQLKIFEMFMQVDRNRNRAQGGLGIGLTLVKRLVELHGGCVDVFSAGLEQGSRFSVRLPISPGVLSTNVPTTDNNLVPNLTQLSLLIVDDNRDAADTLGLLLRQFGATVQVTYDGRSALAVNLSSMHAVILDIGMDDIDGLEVARRIRGHNRDILLIALTGWGQHQDVLATQSSGFDYHLTKPADIKKLLTLLTSARRRTDK